MHFFYEACDKIMLIIQLYFQTQGPLARTDNTTKAVHIKKDNYANTSS